MTLWYPIGTMKRIHIADAEVVVLALQDEIRRSDESRYDHRLHGVLMVAQGLLLTLLVPHLRSIDVVLFCGFGWNSFVYFQKSQDNSGKFGRRFRL